MSVSFVPRCALLLAGGRGIRLSGLTHPSCPKQFVRFGDGFSTFQLALLSASHVADVVYVITLARFLPLASAQASGFNFTVRFIIERESNNTAEAVRIGLEQIERYHGVSTVLVMNTDCVFGNVSSAFSCGIALSEKLGAAILFGLRPREINDQFGYMVYHSTDECLIAKKVILFIEKPNIILAKHLIKTGRCLWNSGFFVHQSSILLKVLYAYHSNNNLVGRSIDTALFNYSKNLWVIDLGDVAWQDVGSHKHFLSQMADGAIKVTV